MLSTVQLLEVTKPTEEVSLKGVSRSNDWIVKGILNKIFNRNFLKLLPASDMFGEPILYLLRSGDHLHKFSVVKVA